MAAGAETFHPYMAAKNYVSGLVQCGSVVGTMYYNLFKLAAIKDQGLLTGVRHKA